MRATTICFEKCTGLSERLHIMMQTELFGEESTAKRAVSVV